MPASWQALQLPAALLWICVELGGEFRNRLLPTARCDDAAIKPVGRLPTWQLSQVVEVGICALAPVEGGITMIGWMP